MKTHNKEEISNALRSASPPIRDFAVSPTLMEIYVGITKKHNLTDRQSIAVSYITSLSLIGLESESAFETNLHQTLPELSHAATTELTADIGTRVFKEARRRVEENILEPSPYSNIPEPDPGFAEYSRINNLDDNDPEWKALEEKEKTAEETDRKSFEANFKEREVPDTDLDDPTSYDASFIDEEAAEIKSSYDLELEAIEKEFAEKQAAARGETVSTEKTSPMPSAPQSMASSVSTRTQPLTNLVDTDNLGASPVKNSIATDKMSAPTLRKEEMRVQVPSYGTTTTVPSVAKPLATPAPTPSATAVKPETPERKGPDPYREAID